MTDETNRSESAGAELDATSTSSTPIRRDRWYQRLKDRLWGYDFFISYHWGSGGTYAVNLAARLREKGYEVFLDRADYAMGDKWKQVGEVALRNTQRLVLIATREAVFESKPVEREVVLFTDRSRHCIPIFFGDTFAREEQEDAEDFVVLDRLPDDTLYIEDTIENLPIGPAPEVVEKLAAAHGIMRRRRIRQTITLIVASLLIVFTVFAGVSWVYAVISRNDALDARGAAEADRDKAKAANIEVEKRLAASYLDNGRDAISSRDFGQAVAWFGAAYQVAPTDKHESLPTLSRELIGGWSSLVGLQLLHEDAVDAVAVSPDGKRIITGGFKGKARLWDASTMEPIGQELQAVDNVLALAFSPDSRAAITITSKGAVERWNAMTGESLGQKRLHGQSERFLAKSQDARLIVTGKGKDAWIWHSETGKTIGGSLHHEGDVKCAAFSHDGSKVITGSEKGEVRVWNANSGSLLYSHVASDHLIETVAFSPEIRIVITGGRIQSLSKEEPRGYAQLWNSTGRVGIELHHARTVRVVAFSPDGAKFVTGTGGDDSQPTPDLTWAMRIWDAKTQKPLTEPLEHGAPIHTLAFSRDGETLVSGSGSWSEIPGEVQIWSAASGTARGFPLRHDSTVTSVVLSGDGSRVVTGSHDGTARIWNVSFRTPRSVQLPQMDSLSAKNSSDDTDIEIDKSGQLRSIKKGGVIGRKLRGFKGDTALAAVSDDGKHAIVASYGERGESQVRLWDLPTGETLGKPLARFPYYEPPFKVGFGPGNAVVFCVTLSPDGTFYEIRFWNVHSRLPLSKIRHYSCRGISITLSPDERSAVTAYPHAQVWSIESGIPIGPPIKAEYEIEDVAFSSDGENVVTFEGLGPKHQGKVDLWHVGRPAEDDEQRLNLSVELLTVRHVDKHGRIQKLTLDEWLKLKSGPSELGGPCSLSPIAK